MGDVSTAPQEEGSIRQTTFRADALLLHNAGIILTHLYGISMSAFVNQKLVDLVEEHQEFVDFLNAQER